MQFLNGRKVKSTWERVALVISVMLVALALTQLAFVKASPKGQVPGLTRVGDDLGDIRVKQAGEDQSRDLLSVTDGGCTYVLVFSTRCPWSREAAKSWGERVTVPWGADSFPLVWLSIDPDEEDVLGFSAEHEIRAPVYTVESSRLTRDLGVALTPSLWILQKGRALSLGEGLRLRGLQAPPADCLNE